MPLIKIRVKRNKNEEKLKERTSWDLELGIYNTVLKDVLHSMSEDRVEETKASYKT